jgi:hypothetical protein
MKKGFSANPERSKAIASSVSKSREGNIDLSSYADSQGADSKGSNSFLLFSTCF